MSEVRDEGRGMRDEEDKMQPPAFERTPAHGYQGDRGAVPPPRRAPDELSLAVSRESGARGGTIARRVAKKLG